VNDSRNKERQASQPSQRLWQGAIFTTLQTINQESVLDDLATVHLLLTALEQQRLDLLAWSALPERMLLLCKQKDGAKRSSIMQALDRFEREYPVLLGWPTNMIVWQRNIDVVVVQNAEEFIDYLGQIHAAPVDAQLVERPEEWPHSSYEEWVERGVYKLGWGWRIAGLSAAVKKV
jgi:putative transposase